MTGDSGYLTADGGGRQAPFTDAEYEEFIDSVLRDPWEPSRDADTLHDISITHPEKQREILIDSARNRVSYRNTDDDTWGLQQKPVDDLEQAVEKLMSTALFIPMHEMHMLGFGGHPDPPSDPAATYEEYDEDDDTPGV